MKNTIKIVTWIIVFLPLLAIPIYLLNLYPPFQSPQSISHVLDLPDSELVSVDALSFSPLQSSDIKQIKKWDSFLRDKENKIILVSKKIGNSKGWGSLRLHFNDGSEIYINEWANPNIGKYSYQFVDSEKYQQAVELFLDTFAKRENSI